MPGQSESHLDPGGIILKKAKIRENNREFFELAPKSIEFCPKSANSPLGQGTNREACGISRRTRVNVEQFRVFAGIQKK
jgi:hypothetical protein